MYLELNPWFVGLIMAVTKTLIIKKTPPYLILAMNSVWRQMPQGEPLSSWFVTTLKAEYKK